MAIRGNQTAKLLTKEQADGFASLLQDDVLQAQSSKTHRQWCRTGG
jgi:hypothetical protein